MTRISFSLAGCALYLSSSVVFAVDPPDSGAVQRLERGQLERLLQEQRLQQQPVKPSISVPTAPVAEPASQIKNIPVKQFQVDTSAILSEGEIRAVLQPYEDKTLSLVDLFEAVAGLNKLYADRKMSTARAFLPPQNIVDGVVNIRLVEARVGEIRLGKLALVSPEFVLQRMSLTGGDLMSVPRLESDLVRFNRLHEVQLRASVQPGKVTGTTDLQLEATEPKPYQFSVVADNAGRDTVGSQRLGFIARATSLTGRSDSLTFSATASKGSDSYYLGYSLPIAPNDLKLDVSYSQGGIKVVEGAFVPLDVSGSSQDFTLGLTKPLVVESGRLWNVYGRASAKESISEFGGVQQQNVDLMVLTLGASGDSQSESSAWAVDANLSQGVTAFAGNSSFSALRANAAWLSRLNQRTQLILRGGLQLSPTDLLPASEQFQLGGNATVRGYSEGLLSGRNGYLASAELRFALQDPDDHLLRNPNAPRFTGMVFFDHGGAFPYRPAPLEDVTSNDFLTGAGLGLIVDWGNHVSARAAVAWPLRDNPNETTMKRPRLHTAVTINWP